MAASLEADVGKIKPEHKEWLWAELNGWKRSIWFPLCSEYLGEGAFLLTREFIPEDGEEEGVP